MEISKEMFNKFREMLFKTKQISHSTIIILIFIAVFTTYLKSSVINAGGDTRWSIPVAMSIIKEGNTNIDEYPFSYGISIDGHIYSYFPIGVSLIAVPLVFIIDEVSERIFSFNLSEYIKYKAPGRIELFIASLITALTAVFIYLIAHSCLGNKKYSLLLAFIFAFCTSAWSTASRALWQHGPSMLMLTTSLYLILLAKSRPWLIQFVSLPLAFSYVIRPTNSIPILLLTVYILIQYEKYFIRYLLWAMVIAVPFFLYNFSVYHYFLSPFYLPQRIGQTVNFWEALAGNLISPSRGLFIFSPILLFSIYGVILRIKNKHLRRIIDDKTEKENSLVLIGSLFILIGILCNEWTLTALFSQDGVIAFSNRKLIWFFDLFLIITGVFFIRKKSFDIKFDKLDYFLLGIIILHWLAISSHKTWWGGSSFGPRYFSDIIPYFIYFLIPVVERIPKLKGIKKIILASILFCFITISFFIHYRGATSWDTFVLWHSKPVSVIEKPERLWDWHDLQFLRGIKKQQYDSIQNSGYDQVYKKFIY